MLDAGKFEQRIRCILRKSDDRFQNFSMENFPRSSYYKKIAKSIPISRKQIKKILLKQMTNHAYINSFFLISPWGKLYLFFLT